MTEKRFEVVINEFDEVEYIMDKVAMEDRDFAEFIDFVEDICNENEQLELENNHLITVLASIKGLFKENSIVTKSEFEKVFYEKLKGDVE